MDEWWLTQVVTNRWVLAIGAYALGFATFWFLSSTGRLPARFRNAADELRNPLNRKSGEDEKLDALAAEIEKAKSLLEDYEDESTSSRELLDELDDTVKRANGRLKLILKSIKRL